MRFQNWQGTKLVRTAKVVTAYGNAQIDTAQSKFGGASGLFDGTGDYLSTPDSADWAFGTGAFTIDFWVRFNALPANGVCQAIVAQYVDGNNWMEFYVYNSAGTYRWYFDTRVTPAASKTWVWGNTTLAVNTWYHVAVVRYGDAWNIYQNGASFASATTTGTVPNNAGNLQIGIWGTGDTFNGWLDELRISKGVARWTSNFTPPAIPHTPDGYDVLLLRMDGADTSTSFLDTPPVWSNWESLWVEGGRDEQRAGGYSGTYCAALLPSVAAPVTSYGVIRSLYGYQIGTQIKFYVKRNEAGSNSWGKFKLLDMSNGLLYTLDLTLTDAWTQVVVSTVAHKGRMCKIQLEAGTNVDGQAYATLFDKVELVN